MTSLAKKDYLHVKLTGGLGNQLFGLAACFEQATRLEAGIAFDLSEYGVDNKRVFEFDYLVSSRKGEITDDYKRVFKEQNPFKFDPQVSDLLPGDLMDGYFQSYLYHEATFEKFKSWVLNEDQIFSTTMRTREIAVHIRRGDYLEKQHLSHHGICDQSYYQAGVSILRSIWGELPVVIFSDSHEEAIRIAKTIPNSKIFKQNGQSKPLDILIRMSESFCIVTSNSSFSWWSARLSSKSYGQVIVPTPWNLFHTDDTHISPSSWIKIPSKLEET